MIRAVGRALAIFDAYDNDHLSLSLQEIAERIQMPKTTAFRLVNTLERAGFLVRIDNQQYCISLKMARLGGLVRSTLSVREIARPVMLEVNEQTRETVTLNTAVNNERMVLEVVDSPSPLMSMARMGQHLPMLLGAASRILMAYMEPKEREEVLKVNTAGIDNFDRAAFDREVARACRQGYAISRGTRVPGLTAIAVPIFDIENRVPYCLAVTGPSVRIDPRDLELADIMMAAGRNISSRLGASPEHGIDMKLLMSDKSMDRNEAVATRKPVAKKTSAAKKAPVSRRATAPA